MVDRWNHSGCFMLYSFKFLIVKCVRKSPYDIVLHVLFTCIASFLAISTAIKVLAMLNCHLRQCWKWGFYVKYNFYFSHISDVNIVFFSFKLLKHTHTKKIAYSSSVRKRVCVAQCTHCKNLVMNCSATILTTFK